MILAGTKDYEGTIISRDRFAPAHVDNLTSDRWYLLQTNDDHYAGECEERCKVGNARM